MDNNFELPVNFKGKEIALSGTITPIWLYS